MSVEVQVTDLLSGILKVDSSEEAFNCFLLHQSDNEKAKTQMCQNALVKFFTDLPSEQVDMAVKQYVFHVSIELNQRMVTYLLQLLEHCVQRNAVSARVVCESLLACDKLTFSNVHFWMGSFKLMKQIIVGVDYKGVREIMKTCLDKAQSIPTQLNPALLPQLQVLVALIEFIFDRNNCLLPGYFIVNEILKVYPDCKKWPHWKIANLLALFVESFRTTAAMVSVVGRSHMLPVVEYSGHASHSINSWKLEPTTLRFALKGSLPYDKQLLEPQTMLLRYILEQPYSRDMVCSMLGLQKQHKQRCAVLEEQIVALITSAMERTENEKEGETVPTVEELDASHWVWQHISSQLIFFVLFQFTSFPHIVTSVQEKLAELNIRKGRDHLMWVLLQFISGSIHKNPLSDFLPVLKLYDLLYPEKEPLPVPDYTKASATHQMAATCIWIHIMKKSQSEPIKPKPIPVALKAHYEFLQHMIHPANPPPTVECDYRLALLCNAYSTNPEIFPRPMGILVETIYGNQKTQSPMPGTNCMANGPTAPLSMSILDSLTVHAKMSLIHNVVTHVIKQAQTKSTLALPPALVETYSRLLVYMEIESLGIKGFMSQLLPQVFKYHAWGILHTLLETFSYRLHHIQPHYRVQLLSHLHSLAAVPQTNHTQLNLCVESTALRLITGLGSVEVQPQLSRFLSEAKTLVSAESEELNRAMVLTLARAIHVTGSETVSGNWCKEILTNIIQNTPHNWANHTLQCFPKSMAEFFQQNQVPKENKQQLKKSVEEEYRNWASMNNENDIIAHFSLQGTPPLFLCLLWKMILETDRINSIAYKVLERIGARALSAHLRKFCEYLVFEFANSGGGQHVNKCIDAMNDMIWKYNIITIDRLILCLALRTQEGSEAQVCFFIIQLLLLKPYDFRNRVQEFVKENSPEHWKQLNWHEKHLAFHRKYPEKFAPEGMLEQSSGLNSQYQSMPVYFGNVCLRFLPVFDIVIHRYLEIPQVAKSLETLLEHLGCLYKFHDRPITYLYNTLHYFERKLFDRPGLKRRLVQAVVGSLKEIRPAGWCLTEQYQSFLARPPDDVNWIPDPEYYVKLIGRLVETIDGKSPFPAIDWRFNEFPNPAAHALHVTCVEIMCLPVAPSTAGGAILDVILKCYTLFPREKIEAWINAIGIVMSALPESYRNVLQDYLVDTVQKASQSQWTYRNSPFQVFSFQATHLAMLDTQFSYILALAHSIWHHSGLGQTVAITQLVKNKLHPIIHSEEQYIFFCHLVGPFLQRFYTERPRCVYELTVELYELLEQVDKSTDHLKYMDHVCDLLYHIKYMFTGDTVKQEVEQIIRNLRPALQKRLRFITHLNIEDIPSNQVN